MKPVAASGGQLAFVLESEDSDGCTSSATSVRGNTWEFQARLA